MNDTVLNVEAGQSALSSLVKSPVRGLIELIWNAFDEDATEVRLDIELSDMTGLDFVRISDNGVGMNEERARMAFGRLGDSWKQTKFTTDEGRPVHGRLGQGRFAAFGLGDQVVWQSTAEAIEGGSLQGIKIEGQRSQLNKFSIAQEDASEQIGTEVTIAVPTQAAKDVFDDVDGLQAALIAEFALHIERHPEFKVYVLGQLLTPESVISQKETLAVELPEDVPGTASITLILWDLPNVPRRLYLTDGEGKPVGSVRPRVHAPLIEFTAYLAWSHVGTFDVDLALLDDDESGEQPVNKVLSAARHTLRDYLQSISRELEAEKVSTWQAEGTHPWTTKPDDEVEAAAYDTFNAVAMAAARSIDEIKGPRQKRLVLRLLKETLQSDPEAIAPIMQEVLKLPNSRVAELKELLERTTLAQVIQSAKEVGNRIDFLHGLYGIVFGKAYKKRLLERRQLHRILANETWIFGEEWSLTGDDERLLKVIPKFLSHLGKEVESTTGSVKILNEDGTEIVPDLVMGRARETAADEWDYLVVELKRPSHTLNDDDLGQIRKYADAITKDETFDQPNVRWTFWLVGNEVSPSVDQQRRQRHLSFGVVQDSDKFKIHVKTWAEIIGDGHHRLKFIQNSLRYSSSVDAGLAAMRDRYAHLLPDVADDAGEGGVQEDDEGEKEAS